jgi:hypothetical protein
LNLHVRNEKWGNEIKQNSFVNFYCVHEHNQMWHISKWWENEVQWTLKRQVYELFKNKMQMRNEEINNEQHEEMKNKKHELKINQ